MIVLIPPEEGDTTAPRNAGWQKSSKLPKTEKDYDDDLYIQRTCACIAETIHHDSAIQEDQIRCNQTERNKTTQLAEWRMKLEKNCS
ncbi:hypothetical protein RB195_009319 [Necator americanus]|uniref:Uncharacterized protein n=1 Tax=Necator americanus TaxID=51031 RepID=A0ABR1CTF9_NECAM